MIFRLHPNSRTSGAVEAVRRAAWRAARPVVAALVTGTPEPPPRSRWLRPRTPRVLGVLPFRTLDLPLVADLALALVLYLAALAWLQDANAVSKESLDVQAVHFIAITYSAPLALRQMWPLAAWRAAALGLVLSTPMVMHIGGAPYDSTTAIMYLLCVYGVAARSDRDVAIGVWVVTFLAAWILYPDTMPLVMAAVTVAVLFGYNVRVRRTATSRLAEEERRTELERARRAVLAERARIARELHDIVAHHMSVIAIQAEAVPLRARGDARQLEAGLAEIRQLSLKTLTEMRRVLGVLRDDSGAGNAGNAGDVGNTAPQPGLDALEDLLETSRAAGLNVSVYVSGSPDDLPEAVSLSAYRIVQESLSNAMRHAPGAAVTVRVERLPGELRLRAANGPGRTEAVPGDGHVGSDGGQGLVGMRERAAMLGGGLEAGPTDDGGFVVSATLPIAEER